MIHTATGPVEPTYPRIIQGGMGVGVSNWRLARTVAMTGQLGVVSGTALDSLLVRRLQDGDPGGHLRRAMERFPLPDVAERVLARYYRPSGRPPDTPYRLLPLYNADAGPERERLTILAAFLEVWLARDGHDGRIGINLLAKIQPPNLASLYGAMLAGVDVVLMGAGIPRDVPTALDRLAVHEPATLSMDLDGPDGSVSIVFDPGIHGGGSGPDLLRPAFFPIVSSETLAQVLVRKSSGSVDGLVVETHLAGGHNAPTRRRGALDDRGEPLYGPRDEPDLVKVAALGLPFWLAGGVGSPAGLGAALDAGARGIQVGTLFAFCRESGIAPSWKERALREIREGRAVVRTDPRASPTGFPFKVVSVPGSIAETPVYEARTRVCDLGYLRTAYRRPDGRIGYRCPAEPRDTYVAKGGRPEDTVGRVCLCNSLVATVGHGQVRSDGPEAPLFTAGVELDEVARFLGDRSSYGAGEVISYLLSESAWTRRGSARGAGAPGASPDVSIQPGEGARAAMR